MTDNIRKDNDGNAYLDKSPMEGCVHIAYQDYEPTDIGTKYHTVFSRDERHMVNGINKIYGTNLNWRDLNGKTLSFFNPSMAKPINTITFNKIGDYYVGEAKEDKNTWLSEQQGVGEIDTMLNDPDREINIVFYGNGDDAKALLKYTRLNFCTANMMSDPSNDIDTTMLVIGNNEFLIPVTMRNFKGTENNRTLLFGNNVIPGIPLHMGEATKSKIAAKLAHKTGYTITTDNFISSDTIRVYSPFDGVNQTYKIHKLHRGEETMYMAVPYTHGVETAPAE